MAMTVQEGELEQEYMVREHPASRESVRAEIALLRGDLRSEIGALRAELRYEVGALRAEMVAGFDAQYRRLVGFVMRFATTVAAVVGVVNNGADRKSTRLNSSHVSESRMPSSA